MCPMAANGYLLRASSKVNSSEGSLVHYDGSFVPRESGKK